MEGPSDEDEQASDNMQEDDQQDSPSPDPSSEVMMGNGGNGVPNEVMRFHPSDGDLFNILLAKISGHSFPTQIYIKVVDQNPRELDFFEPDKIREYCRMEGSDEEQQEWYFFIPTAFIPTGPFLGCLSGLWKMQQASWKRYSKQGEVLLGERFTFEFFLENSSPTSWRLYEYIIYEPPFLPPSNQMWFLYRMSNGEVSEASSTGSGWSQQEGSGTN